MVCVIRDSAAPSSALAWCCPHLIQPSTQPQPAQIAMAWLILPLAAEAAFAIVVQLLADWVGASSRPQLLQATDVLRRRLEVWSFDSCMRQPSLGTICGRTPNHPMDFTQTF